MGSIQAVVELPHTSGFAEDTVVNTIAIETPNAAIGAPFEDIFEAVAGLYNVIQGTANQALAYFLSPALVRSTNAATIKLYSLDGHLDGSPHGSPIAETPFTLSATDASPPFPEEMALAVTLRGNGWASEPVEVPDGPDEGAEVDRPRQRKTGKLYTGPFKIAANTYTVDAANRNRPHATLRNTALDAVGEMENVLNAAGCYLSVWSRANGALYRVTHIEVDDAWDTQRRRGVDPTVRTSRSIYVP